MSARMLEFHEMTISELEERMGHYRRIASMPPPFSLAPGVREKLSAAIARIEDLIERRKAALRELEAK